MKEKNTASKTSAQLTIIQDFYRSFIAPPPSSVSDKERLTKLLTEMFEELKNDDTVVENIAPRFEVLLKQYLTRDQEKEAFTPKDWIALFEAAGVPKNQIENAYNGNIYNQIQHTGGRQIATLPLKSVSSFDVLENCISVLASIQSTVDISKIVKNIGNQAIRNTLRVQPNTLNAHAGTNNAPNQHQKSSSSEIQEAFKTLQESIQEAVSLNQAQQENYAEEEINALKQNLIEENVKHLLKDVIQQETDLAELLTEQKYTIVLSTIGTIAVEIACKISGTIALASIGFAPLSIFISMFTRTVLKLGMQRLINRFDLTSLGQSTLQQFREIEYEHAKTIKNIRTNKNANQDRNQAILELRRWIHGHYQTKEQTAYHQILEYLTKEATQQEKQLRILNFKKAKQKELLAAQNSPEQEDTEILKSANSTEKLLQPDQKFQDIQTDKKYEKTQEVLEEYNFLERQNYFESSWHFNHFWKHVQNLQKLTKRLDLLEKKIWTLSELNEIHKHSKSFYYVLSVVNHAQRFTSLHKIAEEIEQNPNQAEQLLNTLDKDQKRNLELLQTLNRLRNIYNNSTSSSNLDETTKTLFFNQLEDQKKKKSLLYWKKPTYKVAKREKKIKKSAALNKPEPEENVNYYKDQDFSSIHAGNVLAEWLEKDRTTREKEAIESGESAKKIKNKIAKIDQEIDKITQEYEQLKKEIQAYQSLDLEQIKTITDNIDGLLAKALLYPEFIEWRIIKDKIPTLWNWVKETVSQTSSDPKRNDKKPFNSADITSWGLVTAEPAIQTLYTSAERQNRAAALKELMKNFYSDINHRQAKMSEDEGVEEENTNDDNETTIQKLNEIFNTQNAEEEENLKKITALNQKTKNPINTEHNTTTNKTDNANFLNYITSADFAKQIGFETTGDLSFDLLIEIIKILGVKAICGLTEIQINEILKNPATIKAELQKINIAGKKADIIKALKDNTNIKNLIQKAQLKKIAEIGKYGVKAGKNIGTRVGTSLMVSAISGVAQTLKNTVLDNIWSNEQKEQLEKFTKELNTKIENHVRAFLRTKNYTDTDLKSQIQKFTQDVAAGKPESSENLKELIESIELFTVNELSKQQIADTIQFDKQMNLAMNLQLLNISTEIIFLLLPIPKGAKGVGMFGGQFALNLILDPNNINKYSITNDGSTTIVPESNVMDYLPIIGNLKALIDLNKQASTQLPDLAEIIKQNNQLNSIPKYINEELKIASYQKLLKNLNIESLDFWDLPQVDRNGWLNITGIIQNNTKIIGRTLNNVVLETAEQEHKNRIIEEIAKTDSSYEPTSKNYINLIQKKDELTKKLILAIHAFPHLQDAPDMPSEIKESANFTEEEKTKSLERYKDKGIKISTVTAKGVGANITAVDEDARRDERLYQQYAENYQDKIRDYQQVIKDLEETQVKLKTITDDASKKHETGEHQIPTTLNEQEQKYLTNSAKKIVEHQELKEKIDKYWLEVLAKIKTAQMPISVEAFLEFRTVSSRFLETIKNHSYFQTDENTTELEEILQNQQAKNILNLINVGYKFFRSNLTSTDQQHYKALDFNFDFHLSSKSSEYLFNKNYKNLEYWTDDIYKKEKEKSENQHKEMVSAEKLKHQQPNFRAFSDPKPKHTYIVKYRYKGIEYTDWSQVRAEIVKKSKLKHLKDRIDGKNDYVEIQIVTEIKTKYGEYYVNKAFDSIIPNYIAKTRQNNEGLTTSNRADYVPETKLTGAKKPQKTTLTTEHEIKLYWDPVTEGYVKEEQNQNLQDILLKPAVTIKPTKLTAQEVLYPKNIRKTIAYFEDKDEQELLKTIEKILNNKDNKLSGEINDLKKKFEELQKNINLKNAETVIEFNRLLWFLMSQLSFFDQNNAVKIMNFVGLPIFDEKKNTVPEAVDFFLGKTKEIPKNLTLQNANKTLKISTSDLDIKTLNQIADNLLPTDFSQIASELYVKAWEENLLENVKKDDEESKNNLKDAAAYYFTKNETVNLKMLPIYRNVLNELLKDNGFEKNKTEIARLLEPVLEQKNISIRNENNSYNFDKLKEILILNKYNFEHNASTNNHSLDFNDEAAKAKLTPILIDNYLPNSSLEDSFIKRHGALLLPPPVLLSTSPLSSEEKIKGLAYLTKFNDLLENWKQKSKQTLQNLNLTYAVNRFSLEDLETTAQIFESQLEKYIYDLQQNWEKGFVKSTELKLSLKDYEKQSKGLLTWLENECLTNLKKPENPTENQKKLAELQNSFVLVSDAQTSYRAFVQNSLKEEYKQLPGSDKIVNLPKKTKLQLENLKIKALADLSFDISNTIREHLTEFNLKNIFTDAELQLSDEEFGVLVVSKKNQILNQLKTLRESKNSENKVRSYGGASSKSQIIIQDEEINTLSNQLTDFEKLLVKQEIPEMRWMDTTKNQKIPVGNSIAEIHLTNGEIKFFHYTGSNENELQLLNYLLKNKENIKTTKIYTTEIDLSKIDANETEALNKAENANFFRNGHRLAAILQNYKFYNEVCLEELLKSKNETWSIAEKEIFLTALETGELKNSDPNYNKVKDLLVFWRNLLVIHEKKLNTEYKKVNENSDNLFSIEKNLQTTKQLLSKINKINLVGRIYTSTIWWQSRDEDSQKNYDSYKDNLSTIINHNNIESYTLAVETQDTEIKFINNKISNPVSVKINPFETDTFAKLHMRRVVEEKFIEQNKIKLNKLFNGIEQKYSEYFQHKDPNVKKNLLTRFIEVYRDLALGKISDTNDDGVKFLFNIFAKKINKTMKEPNNVLYHMAYILGKLPPNDSFNIDNQSENEITLQITELVYYWNWKNDEVYKNSARNQLINQSITEIGDHFYDDYLETQKKNIFFNTKNIIQKIHTIPESSDKILILKATKKVIAETITTQILTNNSNYFKSTEYETIKEFYNKSVNDINHTIDNAIANEKNSNKKNTLEKLKILLDISIYLDKKDYSLDTKKLSADVLIQNIKQNELDLNHLIHKNDEALKFIINFEFGVKLSDIKKNIQQHLREDSDNPYNKVAQNLFTKQRDYELWHRDYKLWQENNNDSLKTTNFDVKNQNQRMTMGKVMYLPESKLFNPDHQEATIFLYFGKYFEKTSELELYQQRLEFYNRGFTTATNNGTENIALYETANFANELNEKLKAAITKSLKRTNNELTIILMLHGAPGYAFTAGDDDEDETRLELHANLDDTDDSKKMDIITFLKLIHKHIPDNTSVKNLKLVFAGCDQSSPHENISNYLNPEYLQKTNSFTSEVIQTLQKHLNRYPNALPKIQNITITGNQTKSHAIKDKRLILSYPNRLNANPRALGYTLNTKTGNINSFVIDDGSQEEAQTRREKYMQTSSLNTVADNNLNFGASCSKKVTRYASTLKENENKLDQFIKNLTKKTEADNISEQDIVNVKTFLKAKKISEIKWIDTQKNIRINIGNSIAELHLNNGEIKFFEYPGTQASELQLIAYLIENQKNIKKVKIYTVEQDLAKIDKNDVEALNKAKNANFRKNGHRLAALVYRFRFNDQKLEKNQNIIKYNLDSGTVTSDIIAVDHAQELIKFRNKQILNEVKKNINPFANKRLAAFHRQIMDLENAVKNNNRNLHYLTNNLYQEHPDLFKADLLTRFLTTYKTVAKGETPKNIDEDVRLFCVLMSKSIGYASLLNQRGNPLFYAKNILNKIVKISEQKTNIIEEEIQNKFTKYAVSLAVKTQLYEKFENNFTTDQNENFNKPAESFFTKNIEDYSIYQTKLKPQIVNEENPTIPEYLNSEFKVPNLMYVPKNHKFNFFDPKEQLVVVSLINDTQNGNQNNKLKIYNQEIILNSKNAEGNHQTQLISFDTNTTENFKTDVKEKLKILNNNHSKENKNENENENSENLSVIVKAHGTPGGDYLESDPNTANETLRITADVTSSNPKEISIIEFFEAFYKNLPKGKKIKNLKLFLKSCYHGDSSDPDGDKEDAYIDKISKTLAKYLQENPGKFENIENFVLMANQNIVTSSKQNDYDEFNIHPQGLNENPRAVVLHVNRTKTTKFILEFEEPYTDIEMNNSEEIVDNSEKIVDNSEKIVDNSEKIVNNISWNKILYLGGETTVEALHDNKDFKDFKNDQNNKNKILTAPQQPAGLSTKNREPQLPEWYKGLDTYERRNSLTNRR